VCACCLGEPAGHGVHTFARLDPIALGNFGALAGNRLPAFSQVQRVPFWRRHPELDRRCAFNGWNDPQNPEIWRLTISHPIISLATLRSARVPGLASTIFSVTGFLILPGKNFIRPVCSA